MNRLLPLFFLGAALFASLNKAYAQPTVYVDPSFVLVDSLEETCVKFRTVDFTDIMEMRFTIKYNPSAIDFIDIPVASLNPGLPNFSLASFTVDEAAGHILFTWKIQDVPGCPTIASTLPDDEVLFEICFMGVQGYSKIEIVGDPEPIYVTRLNSCPLHIGLFIGTGFIAVDNQPLTINVPYINANAGETVCVDFTVENFTDIVSLQFSVNWFPTVLSITSLNGFLPGWSSGGSNVNQALGFATFSWFNPDPTQGLSVANGTSVFQICYEVTGFCGQTSPVTITNNPTPVEITYEGDEGIDIGVLNGVGAVTVNCFNPNGTSFIIPDADICPGESFCVDVTTENFSSLVSFQYSVNWNPDVIQFTGISNINSNLFLFNAGNFNTAGSTLGRFTVNWNDPSCFGGSLPNGATLFTMCFTSVGGGGVNTTLSITDTPLDIMVTKQCFGANVPPNTFNGFVNVCELPGVVVSAGSTSTNPGQNVCVPISVQQFEDVEQLQFSIIWESSVLDYTGVSNFNLPGLTAGNFDASFIDFGALCITWTPPSGTGVTVLDGTTIFDLCFNAIGDPFECSPISFTEFPCLIDVVTGESNGTNVGIIPSEGEVCMLNPFNFSVIPVGDDAFQNTEVCVQFEVTNFISLAELNFSVNWDPSVLLYSSINNQNLFGFNATSYNDANALFGTLSINWSAPLGNGLSLPNGVSIFEICFIMTGAPGTCSPVAITGTPTPIFVSPASSGGVNIGLLTQTETLCSSQFISLASIDVTGVDCTGDNSGAIDITVSGGSGNYSYNWSGPGIIPPNNTNEDQFNLTNGTYFVTITDNVYGTLVLNETIVVGFSPNAPVADAGGDTSLPCGGGTMELDGTASSQGAQYAYLWQAISGGSVGPGTETSPTPTIFGPGAYQLAVTDLSTGCTAFDTVQVAAAVSPGVEISLSSNINCQVDTVTLSGIGSTVSPNIVYSWTTVGGAFVPGTQDSLITQAVAGGWYYFTATNINNNCAASDSLEVVVDQAIPTVAVSPDTVLNCINNVILLSGAGSSTGGNISYQWVDPMGTPISTNLSTQVSQPGVYTLFVTNTENFCQASDSVIVLGDIELPTVVATVSSMITCVVDTITLLGTGSSSGASGDFTYLWTGPGLVAGTAGQIDAQAFLPGSYALAVTDNSNGCQALAVVLLSKDTIPPVAEVGTADPISCLVTEVPLNGTGSSAGTPGQFTYLWSGPGVQAGTETMLLATAEDPGVYTLTVTRASNGCTASDQVTVQDNANFPNVNIVTPDTIDCNNPNITLNALGSTVGPGIQYIWSGPFCINTTNPLLPIVGCAGTFTLQITNTNNGCVTTENVVVIADNNDPTAEAENGSFKCSDTEIQLDGTASSQGPLFSYQWAVLNGATITGGINTLTPTVNGPGSYGLLVTNMNNGCTANTIANVVADTIPPVVSAGLDTEITCTQPNAQLNGSTGLNVTLQWLFNGAPIPGATGATFLATEAGTYTLQATSTLNGCVGSDNAIVDANDQPPVANAGTDQELGCEDNSVQLDGSGSDSGPGITYAWTTINGVLDPGSIANPVAIASEEGTYILTVSDQNTGCVGTDTVVVMMVIGLDLASASFDGDPCDIEAFLMGNLPEGVTGVWTVNTSAVFEDPANPNTNILNLVPGVNLVTWTLSSPNCPNYSSTTLEVFVEGKPIANNDVALIIGDVESVEINLLANDLLLGIGDYQLNILPFTGPGSVEPLNPLDGVVTYFASPFFSGNTQFNYELCNNACPNLCDTAFVRVTIEKDIDLNESVPNGITPNGDGLNDVLIFDIIDPVRYPNNSLVIFSRWGDVVFEAKPYLNNWGGDSKSGPLPAGTYYYILRLDIDDAKIIRGDVTIVR